MRNQTAIFRQRGFTLIEMLVVLAIIAVLTVAAIPSIVELFSASLTQGGLEVSGALSYCRQAAIATNQAMEFRLYQYVDANSPGETVGNLSSGKFSAFQIFKITDAGVGVPEDLMERLPTGVIIDSGINLSSVMGQTKAWTALDPQIALPGIGTSYNCVAFRFHPDGSTNLSSTPPSPPNIWCLTLHRGVVGDNLSSLPSNYVTIGIDPVSGKIVNFNP